MTEPVRWWQRSLFVVIVAFAWSAILLVCLALFIESDLSTALVAFLGVLTTIVGILVSRVDRYTLRPRGIAGRSAASVWSVAAANDLAEVVRHQWDSDAEHRNLDNDALLDVQWSRDDEFTDPSVFQQSGRRGGRAVVTSKRTGLPAAGDIGDLATVFAKLPVRRLVILGPLGSGKSVLAMTLVRDLLDRRKAGQPVPVLFMVGTWNPERTTLAEWLTEQLVVAYKVSSASEGDSYEVASQLLRDRLILPVLDGLDEIAAAARPFAVQQINAWLGRDRQIVVTSRAAEYRAAVAAADIVTANGTIVLQPLPPDVAQDYLRANTPPQRVAQWDRIFADMDRRPDGPLAAALRTPLMVALARAIYGDRPGDLARLLEPSFDTPGKVEEHLLSELIQATYPKSEHGLQADRVQVWLTFLARELRRRGQADVAWWELERSAPPVAVHVVAAAAGAVVLDLVFGLWTALAFAAAVLFLAADRRAEQWTLEGLLRKPVAAWLPRLSGRSFWHSALGVIIGTNDRVPLERRLSLSTGRIVALVAGLIRGFVVYSTDGIYRAVAEGLAVGLAVGLADGYLTVSIRSVPSEVRFATLRGAAAFARHVAVGFATGVGVGLTAWAISFSGFGILVGILVGLAFGVIDGLNIWLDVSTDVTRSLSPRSTRTAEGLAALARCLTLGCTLIVTTGIAYTFAYGFRAAVVPALIFGVGYAFADHHMGLATSVWGRYISAKAWLALRGRVPWRYMNFLEDTYRHELLRRAGAVYQFRHARFQDYLIGDQPSRAV
jgi:hypothetical protein